MIKVFGRLLCVPENEKMLGFVDDNLVETRKFKITDPALFSFSFKLELENGSFINIADLDPSMEDGALVLTWEIPSTCLRFAGPLYAQLRAFNNADMVWHSEIAEFTVCRSLQAETALPPVVPTEFAEMEKRLTGILSSAEAVSCDVEAFSDAAKDAAQTAANAAGEATSLSETFFASAAACETHAARCAEMLNRVLAEEESVSGMQEAVLASLQNAMEAKEESACHAQKAETYKNQIETSLGDLHAALDAILSMEEAYIGGEAA